jgi:hypothetical protein
MEFDHDWEPGENDSPARRWVRRIVFVFGIVAMAWIVALIGGWTAMGDDKPSDEQLPQTSSTYMPEEPFESGEWDSARISLAYSVVEAGWENSPKDKLNDLCLLMQTGYRERAVRSVMDFEDSYEYSFELDPDVDWYFGAQLMEAKCMRRP